MARRPCYEPSRCSDECKDLTTRGREREGESSDECRSLERVKCFMVCYAQKTIQVQDVLGLVKVEKSYYEHCFSHCRLH